MIVLFVFGEDLPTSIVPPATAFIAGSLALLVISAVQVSSVDAVFRELDWRTLLFLACTFCLVQAVTNTGLLQSLSLQLYAWFGAELKVVSMYLLAGVGLVVERARQYAGRRGVDHDAEGLSRRSRGRARGSRSRTASTRGRWRHCRCSWQ